jgi:hypothetical protein
MRGRGLLEGEVLALEVEVGVLVERFLRHLGNRCRTEDPGVEEEQVQRSEPRRHR